MVLHLHFKPHSGNNRQERALEVGAVSNQSPGDDVFHVYHSKDLRNVIRRKNDMSKELEIGKVTEAFSTLYSCLSEGLDEGEEVHKIVSDACKRADKYGWHDLKKYPTDLPRGLERVHICYILKNDYMKFYRDGYVLMGVWHFATADISDEIKGDVVAWKYNEPFEEES